MGLDNVAVQWPRTGRFYEPVAPAEFADFAEFAEAAPPQAGPAAALASHIAQIGHGTGERLHRSGRPAARPGRCAYATEAAAEDEDPVIDPDGCAWIAGGLETLRRRPRRVRRHASPSTRSRRSCAGARRGAPGRAAAALAGDPARRAARRARQPAAVELPLLELDVLAHFYRRCADRGFAVYADSLSQLVVLEPRLKADQSWQPSSQPRHHVGRAAPGAEVAESPMRHRSPVSRW